MQPRPITYTHTNHGLTRGGEAVQLGKGLGEGLELRAALLPRHRRLGRHLCVCVYAFVRIVGLCTYVDDRRR